MTQSSNDRLAGFLLIVIPTVAFGGTSILRMLIQDSRYIENELRRDLWAAGHAHAGVFLVLSLVMLQYGERVNLPKPWQYIATHGVPIASILIPAAMFLSVMDPEAVEPNRFINLAYVGAFVFVVSTISMGVGLLRYRVEKESIGGN